MPDIAQPGTYYYNGAGSNTPVQVTDAPTAVYQISVGQNGGSAGFLQVYNNGTYNVQGAGGTVIGTPDFVVPVASGTSGAGTPAVQTISYAPYGRVLDGGLSFIWSAGATGTVAHGVNAIINIDLRNI